jgi:hypothetical protein
MVREAREPAFHWTRLLDDIAFEAGKQRGDFDSRFERCKPIRFSVLVGLELL